MRDHSGRPGVQRALFDLSKLAAGCARHAAENPGGALADIVDRAQVAARQLADADQRKQWTLAEVKRAQADLDEAYDRALDYKDRLSNALVALHGRRSPALADYGVRPRPPRGQRRARASATAPASTETSRETPADAPAGPPAKSPAQPPAAMPAKEDSHG